MSLKVLFGNTLKYSSIKYIRDIKDVQVSAF